jgi:hypothetical protein
MYDDDASRESFEETLRAIARQLAQSVEHLTNQIDMDELAGAAGVDPDSAREWVGSAGTWFRAQVERLGGEVPFPSSRPRPGSPGQEALRGAAPHPLDLPTEEQGLALAALDSGRWTVERGTDALAVRGDGPGPSDALGVVHELRSRDWIAADGEVTLVGRYALSRWIDAAARS